MYILLTISIILLLTACGFFIRARRTFRAAGVPFNTAVLAVPEWEHKRMEMALGIFQNTLEGLVVFTQDMRIVEVNPAVERISGRNASSLLGEKLHGLFHAYSDFSLHVELENTLADKDVWEGEAQVENTDGHDLPVWLRIARLPHDEGGHKYFIASFHDISVLKRREEQIRYMAMHDPLTGLPNRNFLQRHLDSIFSSQQAREHMAIIYFDLDGFKQINDTLGHDAGDKVLRLVGERVSQRLRSHDIVVRVGGDEFVIVCQRVTGESQAVEVVHRLLDALSAPFVVQGTECTVGASIGIAAPPEGGRSVEELLKNADVAMYAAKKSGKNNFCFFNKNMLEKNTHALQIEQRFHQALTDKDFSIHFQPVMALSGHSAVGVEALVRWNDNAPNLPPPRVIVRMAEESGRIFELTQIVIEKALAGFAQLQKEQSDLFLALNVSPSLLRSNQLPELLDNALRGVGVAPHSIVLEIPEHAFEDVHSKLHDEVRVLTKRGYRVAVDNFGSVYHSFSYLKHMPVAFLKVDGMYIRDMLRNQETADLVKGVRDMGDWINSIVVAGGVETGEQGDCIRSLGYECGQGYFYCSPAPVESTLKFLRAMNAATPNADA